MAEQVVTIGDFTTPLNRATVSSGGALKVDGSAAGGGAVTITSGTVTADTEMPAAAALDDATANPTSPMVGAAAMGFNGTNWERWTHNLELTVLASAARTSTTNSPDISNFNGRGAHFIIDVTAVTSTPSTTFTVQGKDAVSGKYFPLLVSAAIATVSTTVLSVYPGITATANVSAAIMLSRYFRVVATHGNANSMTYSVGAVLVI